MKLWYSLCAAFLLAGPLAAQSSPAAPAPGEVTAASDKDDRIIELDQFTVTSESDRGYNAANSVGASRVVTPIKNTPASVTVLNAQFIHDVNAIELTDALRYETGVAGANAPNSGGVTLRGQNIPGTAYRDGFFDPIQTFGTIGADPSLVERLEIIKGPAGTLYGSHNSGGIINQVTKEPLFHAQTILQTTFGDWDMMRAMIDTTDRLGPMGRLGQFAYRLVLTSQNAETAQGTALDTFVLAPQVSWRNRHGTKIVVRFAYEHPQIDVNSFSWFTDKDGKLPYFLPRDRALSDRDGVRDIKSKQFDFDLEQTFRTGIIDWAARGKFRYSFVDSDTIIYTTPSANFRFYDAGGTLLGTMDTVSFGDPRFVNGGTVRISRVRALQTDLLEAGGTYLDLVGSFLLGPTKHQLLLYSNYYRSNAITYSYSGNYDVTDIYRPSYETNPSAAWQRGSARNQDSHVSSSNVAYAVQDNLSLLDERATLVLGARNDRAVTTTVNRITNTRVYGDVRGASSYKVGAVVRPVAPVGLYYNYSQTFTPNGFDAFTGAKLPNLKPVTNEIGTKVNLANDALIFDYAYFDVESKNALVPRTVIDSTGFARTTQVPAGTVVVKGWEADLTWAPNNNFALISSAGDLKSKSQTGIRARAVPQKLNYRFFAKYTFTENNWLKGISLGIGQEHTSERALDSNDTATLPAYDLTEAMLSYGWKRWMVQANVYNLFNKNEGWIGVARFLVYPLEPRRLRTSLTYTF